MSEPQTEPVLDKPEAGKKTSITQPEPGKKTSISLHEPGKKSNLSQHDTRKHSRGSVDFRDLSRLNVRRASYGFGGVPGIRPIERTSQTGIEFKRPIVIYLPTYQLESLKKFHLANVLKAVEEVLDETWNDHKYHEMESPALAIRLAGECMRKVKAMGFNRYRIISIVTIAQKRKQSYNNTIGLLWDYERDGYIDTHRETTTAFVQFEYDPELLIEEVKKRPGLWDYGDINYRTMATRLELWNEVVKELLHPNVDVSNTEMRELVLQLQKKWKSVKDSFQKYVQNPNRTKRPYIYCKQLQFLMKNDPKADFEGGTAGASSESEDAPLVKKRKVIKWRRNKTKQSIVVKEEGQSSEEDDNADQYVEIEPYENDEPEKTNAKSPNKTIEDFAFASVTNIDTGGEDCDKMFLLSLLPHLKSIPQELRLNAKMELLRVLRNANHDYSMTGDLISES